MINWDSFIDNLIKNAYKCPDCKREEAKCIEQTSVYDIIEKVRQETIKNMKESFKQLLINKAYFDEDKSEDLIKEMKKDG